MPSSGRVAGIRDDIRGMRTDQRAFAEDIRGIRADQQAFAEHVNARFEVIETTLRDLAEQMVMLSRA